MTRGHATCIVTGESEIFFKKRQMCVCGGGGGGGRKPFSSPVNATLVLVVVFIG